MDKLNITVEEVMQITHKSRDFIISAIQQGTFPGSVVVNENGRRNVHIPRKAFEDYMSFWRHEPNDELIIALIKKISTHQKKSASVWTITF